MTKVKICGLSQVRHALVATEAGADFIGMVFARSKRQVSADSALKIIEAASSLSYRPSIVGVFANSSVDEVNGIGDFCHLDWIQLSGDEDWDYCKQIKKPIIKTIHIEPTSTSQLIYEKVNRGYQLMPVDRLIFLLDTKVEEQHGGTGQIFDWRLAKEISAKFPVIVAGGLTPDNASRLINEVHPWGVDVSSGVESNNMKSAVKIRDFIKSVRQTDDIDTARLPFTNRRL
ncbi:MAG: phosphoribosylanthranilate isomerase [Chloroflexi bacterium]|nr:phosphoribosylanthranilate isomerase [Chloroflexota bacterium]